MESDEARQEVIASRKQFNTIKYGFNSIQEAIKHLKSFKEIHNLTFTAK
ncbi:MAG: hypothetical protein QXZ47_01415 [Candidatus Bathyarchaeia archaeon]